MNRKIKLFILITIFSLCSIVSVILIGLFPVHSNLGIIGVASLMFGVGGLIGLAFSIE